MGHENGDKQRLGKRRHVQGMLDETDPLNLLGKYVTFVALARCEKTKKCNDSVLCFSNFMFCLCFAFRNRKNLVLHTEHMNSQPLQPSL